MVSFIKRMSDVMKALPPKNFSSFLSLVSNGGVMTHLLCSVNKL